MSDDTTSPDLRERITDALEEHCEHPHATTPSTPDGEHCAGCAPSAGDITAAVAPLLDQRDAEIERLTRERSALEQTLSAFEESAAAGQQQTDDVAQRGADAIIAMGCEIRTIETQRERYRTAWSSARIRAAGWRNEARRIVREDIGDLDDRIVTAWAEQDQLKAEVAELQAAVRPGNVELVRRLVQSYARLVATERDGAFKRAEQAEAANARARVLATEALAAWTPEHEHYQERAARKGYSHDETAAEIYGYAIGVVKGILTHLEQDGERT